MSAPALPSSRDRSAGIDPGPAGHLPAWWGDDDWLAEVRAAVLERREVCREHHVDPGTVVSVARGMAHYADFRTGRDARPTNARLVELLQVSLSTVQRARRALKALGLVVEQVAGRSMMTRAERLAAWRRGSSHRRIAATFALCSRSPRRGPTSRRLAPERGAAQVGYPSGYQGADLGSVDGDTPPGALVVRGVSHLSRSHLRRRTERGGAAPRPAHTRGSSRGGDPATRRLAEQVSRRLRWLRGTSVARIGPALHRFAQAGWSSRDVERGLADAMTRAGWFGVPADLRQPAAYLARLLRDLDPADRPGALDEHMAAVERAQRAYERLLVIGTPCPHGQPAGDVPSPLRGLLACPACRNDREVPW